MINTQQPIPTRSYIVRERTEPQAHSLQPIKRYSVSNAATQERLGFATIDELTEWISKELGSAAQKSQGEVMTNDELKRMTHRICDIVTSINLYLGLIESTTPDKHPHFFKKIRDCTDSLMTLTNCIDPE